MIFLFKKKMSNKTSIRLILLISLITVMVVISCANKDSKFANPILAGFYPDPSICRVDDNFYLVTSTFSYFPGIPVFQSKDLVNWKLIGHVLDRPEVFNLEGQGVSRGVFAPTIRYNDGVFYVTCTIVDIGGNFVATAKSPEGPWTDPVWIPEVAGGIDPSLFFDVGDPDSIGDNGKGYLIYNSVAPDNEPLYQGHRTIRMYEFDIEKLKVVGEEKLLVNGGVDLSQNPIWIEAPHIFKIDGTYFLIAAEGGTADWHSEVVFKSEKVDGPYIPYEHNPILTQRHLDPNRKNPITSTGHADFVQTDDGEWWAVFLGLRPYSMKEDEYYNLGRETFLAPVKWIDGWPVINPDYVEVQYSYPYPLPSKSKFADRSYGGNFNVRYNFDDEELDINWMFLRSPHKKWYSLTDKIGFVAIDVRPETCSGSSNPSFLGHRQQHIIGSASTSLFFNPLDDNEKAGLLIFLNERHFYLICKSLENNEPVIQLYKSVEQENFESLLELITLEKINIENSKKNLNLKIEANGKYYSFFYSYEKEEWRALKENVDATFLRAVIPSGDYTGCVFALYATSLGEESTSKSYFDYFEYEGNDEVYGYL